MAEKDTAGKLAAEVKATDVQKEKTLPVLAQPTVSLPVEIRQAIAIRCRDQKESFSIKSVRLWIDLLKSEKRIAADLKVDLSAKRGGFAGMKEKIEEKDATISELKAQLAALQAKKGN